MAGDHLVRKSPSLFVDTRSASYQDDCRGASQGFLTPTDSRHTQVHHILPVVAVRARSEAFADKPADDRQYVEDLVTNIAWDINELPNLWSHPTNTYFREVYGRLPESAWSKPGVPSHNCDHGGANGYNLEVKRWLEMKIWRQLELDRADHAVDVGKATQGLVDAVKHFRRMLSARARRSGTAVEAWKSRFDEGNEDTWYAPFSMADRPTERAPGSAGVPNAALKRKV